MVGSNWYLIVYEHVERHKRIKKSLSKKSIVPLDEFRYHKRALTALELELKREDKCK